MSQVLYKISDRELELLNRQRTSTTALVELWEGLPPEINFQETWDGNGRLALRACGRGLYVWIPADTVREIRHDPKRLLMAMGRRAAGKIDFFFVEPFPLAIFGNHSREDYEYFAIRYVKDANLGILNYRSSRGFSYDS